MKKPFSAAITGISHYLPEQRLTNADLEKMVETNDEWIRSRTGIAERRILEDGKGTSYLVNKAMDILLEQKSLDPKDIDLIIVATITPDMIFPATACLVQEYLGAKNAWAFDLSAACCGFLYALVVGAQFVETGAHKKVAVIGADKMSSVVDYTDRETCILFGDGAGAVLLEPAEENMGLHDFILHADGSGKKHLNQLGGGSLHPATHETVDQKLHYIRQQGREVFRFAVPSMAEVSAQILERNGLVGKDIDLFVPHQANKRIIDGTLKRLNLPEERAAINIDRYANTAAGTIPIALSEAVEQGRVKRGDTILLASAGAGYTWGSALLTWAY
ncbi:MAG: ketoacyl-ACP synthase III [bacterium]|nr:ketoacyl-ACP synthase III [bacterium]